MSAAAAAGAGTDQPRKPLWVELLRPISSLRLTVFLLLMGMILIFAGTTVQAEKGIWDVQHQYFHSWYTILELRLFFPLWQWGFHNVPGKFPFPGGYTLIVLLLANLLSAHAIRFRFHKLDALIIPELALVFALTWPTYQYGFYVMLAVTLVALGPLVAHLLMLHAKRGPVILLHLGLIVLLVGEVITSQMAVESQMVIDEGSSADFASDSREIELAVTDRSLPDKDVETLIPGSTLAAGETISHPSVPFNIKIDRFYANSDIAGPMQNVAGAEALATAGNGVGMKLLNALVANGTESSVDLPSAFVTLTTSAGENLGTYLLSTMPLDPTVPPIDLPQSIKVGGKEYWVHLRFKRHYKPYTIELLKFSHDRYLGTDVAKNFSSRIRLIDPSRNVDREVLIWMNHPLRYAGETFYQASFRMGDQTTILQVVRNPAWLIPYISCTMVGLGLLMHFGMHLLKFIERVNKPAPAGTAREMDDLVPAGVGSSGNGNGNGNGNGHGKAAVATIKRGGKKRAPAPATALLTARRHGSAIPATIITVMCGLQLFSAPFSNKPSGPAGMDDFAHVPVSFEGRTMPLDSLARNSLRILSGKDTISLDNGEEVPAINWLLDVFAHPEKSGDYKVFRIDHPDILSLLDLKASFQKASMIKSLLGMAERERFSPAQVFANIEKFKDQYDHARAVQPKSRDAFQRQVMEIGQHLLLYNQLAGVKTLFLSPPLENTEWRSFADAIRDLQDKQQRDPGAEAFLGMIQASADNQPGDFSTIAAEYHRLIDSRLPDVSRRLDVELMMNRAAPFIQCMVLYVIVFVLAAVSWLKWHGPLARAALWLLILTLVYHSLGLIARVYIMGRPPVTNLYSSAIFIAWAAVVFCVVMELIFRNGIPSAAAAMIAFPSLLIAHYLGSSGDTMQMLQAVLDTNIWLATHVVLVTLGYTATFLAGFMGIFYIFRMMVGRTRLAETLPDLKTIARMIYGIVCFAMLFSFIGTILGGIWADQSWGRFWGWDPKENGAVLIVLWNAIILHARWGGIVKERGVAMLAVGGNIVTAWSWFGTNMLGIGLHSYGFMEAAVFWITAWVALNVVVIGIAALAQRAPTPRVVPA